MVVLSVIDIVLLIAGLAFYLFVVGTQLDPDRHEPRGVLRHRRRRSWATPQPIVPGVEHINRTGGVVAGALPLLYGMAEGIVAGVYAAAGAAGRARAGPAGCGRRRSRLHDGVGYRPNGTSPGGAHARPPADEPQVPA